MDKEYNVELKSMKTDVMERVFMLNDKFFTDLDAPEVQKGNLTVDLQVRRTSGLYVLNFHTHGTILIPCDRCLDDMELPIDTTDELRVKMGDHYDDENEIIEIDENEGFLNVAWFIYEFIALNIPMTHVHEPGACNEAMVEELNKHLCVSVLDEDDEDSWLDADDDSDDDVTDSADDDAPREIDPRWNALKKILDNN
jgi:uncharacterized metal-binding protein YceD (DUF177 family)